ncbi:MAG: amino acid-binding protein [Armatimonadota bacterium]|nr:MAG: amino acid-binding protein [Armatimonadota bacterium]
MKVSQITVFLENKKGRLAEVTEALARRGVNIRAASIADTIDYGLLRLIVSDPVQARQALAEAGFSASETEVLAVEVEDRPGGLASIIRCLADAGINIEYLYAFVGKSGEKAIVVLRSEDTERAREVLQKNNVTLLSGEQVHRL